MIYLILIIDGDSGILLIERQYKPLEKKKNNLNAEILAGFFKAVNKMIDEIQFAMKKGRDVSNMTRLLEGENSLIIIYYQPIARVLVCAISDPDDNHDEIIGILKTLGKRFWAKHRRDLDLFRKEGNRERFSSFGIEIDTYSLEGKVAEKFPKLLIALQALERVKMMGVIDDLEYKVAKICNGKNSVLKISKELGKSEDDIKKILNKLAEFDIIKE
ncbi:MAG: hypothetical protein ACTSU2_11135 [Promethearchaeota archaeon]